jgi:butyryl-CoA dehydrogenase
MTVQLSDEEAMLVETVRAFIDREVKPAVRDVEHANEYPEAWIEQMKRIGIYGLAISEEYGGTPVSMPCYVEVTQELSRGWMSLAGAMGGHTVVAKLLTLFGTDEQKRKYLPVMATGERGRRWRSPSRVVAAIYRTCRPPPCAMAMSW